MPLTSALRRGDLQTCADTSRTCCFLSSLQICLDFNGAVGTAGISQCSTETEEMQKSVLKTSFHPAKTEEEIAASFTHFGTFLL